MLETIAQTAQPPDNGPGDAENGDDGRAVDDPQPPNRPANRPTENGPGVAVDAVLGGSGDSGGCFGTLSDDGVSDELTPDEWRRTLLDMADDLEPADPDRAAELRRQAVRVDA